MQLRSIVAAYSLLVLSVTILLWVIYLTTKPRQAAFAWWAGAFTSLVIATGAFSLQDRLPRLLYVVLFNGFVHAFFLILIEGIRILRGQRPRFWPFAIVALVGLAWNLWFTFGVDRLDIRAVQYSIFSATFSSAFALSILRSKFEERSPVAILSVFSFTIAGLQLLRIGLILAQGYGVTVIEGMPWDGWIQALILLNVSLIAITLIFLVALRLNTALAASARERELLVREMTHRIKNDLALVDGLIALEELSVEGTALAERFSALRERIACIAAAHDLLSRHDGELGSIPAADYFAVIARGLPSSPRVEVSSDFREVELPLALALSAGIVLSELAVNAIKYAFPEYARGRLRLSFRAEEGLGRLEVGDDGIGMEWPPRKRGLGTLIVETMVKNLKGRLHFSAVSGSCFSIDFPLPPR